MKSFTVAGCVFVLVLACFAWSMTSIEYRAGYLGGTRWQYTYEVANFGLLEDGQPSGIKEFTIWFDKALYRNLTITSPAYLSADWDQITLEPEPVLHDDGAFDALATLPNSGIYAGQSVYGFSVSFDWLGQDMPGPQFYEIIDPATFEAIDSGFTVPEPVTILLFALGSLVIRKGRHLCG